MENRSLLEDQVKVKFLDGDGYGRNMKGRPVSCSKCYEKVAELACSACLLCVSCPLSIVWCCIMLPCRLAYRAARLVTQRTCCGSEKWVFGAYSSFSDIDSSDSLLCKLRPCFKESDATKRRIAQKQPK
ncbi:hypothetical protein Ddye_015435 [Dipteronia dyeriana]|uniref:Uncharacterized protein n=1 Tax=Dipteronia dyeriana TaxID=168575 RepID=A0AAD9U5M1_9ROSI|nr:hypothetical protein Ddye_015435 [Dipteronia dyeriana]